MKGGYFNSRFIKIVTLIEIYFYYIKRKIYYVHHNNINHLFPLTVDIYIHIVYFMNDSEKQLCKFGEISEGIIIENYFYLINIHNNLVTSINVYLSEHRDANIISSSQIPLPVFLEYRVMTKSSKSIHLSFPLSLPGFE